ncbi:MAG: hypothetical protein QOK14_217, partial [Frankiaceae bacterium]|nr:hypothetical protein [Frankiaceae bacterium]
MRLPLRARLYVVAVSACGLLASVVAATHVHQWPSVALLAALMVGLVSLASVELRWVDVSLGLVVAVAAVALVGA